MPVRKSSSAVKSSEIETWPIDRLKPYARNARVHPPEQIRQLRASIRKFGQVWPILVDEGGTIIAGHGRLQAAKREKMTEVTVIVAKDWDERRRREFALLDNREAWKLFAPFHYLTAELHKSAACYVLFVEGAPASFVGVLHMPHAHVDDVKRISRIVTLPDYQGIGLAMILAEKIAAAHKVLGHRFRNYPAHPSFVRSHDRSPHWVMKKEPGRYSPALGRTSTMRNSAMIQRHAKRWSMGSRPCAVFEYVGPAMSDANEARALISGTKIAPAEAGA
jgi:GNAT superfamily N-acetyltransferase